MARKALTRAKVLMLTQGMTGARLHELTGIDAGDISRIINGLAKPYPSQGRRIAEALQWAGEPDELFREVVLIDG